MYLFKDVLRISRKAVSGCMCLLNFQSCYVHYLEKFIAIDLRDT